MTICSVHGCSARSENGTKLFSVPAIRERGCPKTIELSKRRRALWLSRLNRKEIPSNTRVCSKHFVKGRPCDVMIENDPDWAPSLHLGYCKNQPAPDRFNRLVQRSLRVPLAPVNDQHGNVLDVRDEEDIITSKSVECQTEVAGLFAKLDLLDKPKLYSELYFEQHEKKVKFYSGLPNFTVLNSVFKLVSQFVPYSNARALTKFQEFMVVMMRLRLGLLEEDLGDRFGVVQSTVSKILDRWIPVMAHTLQGLIVWPDRETLRNSTPDCFRKNFGTNVVVIIDCFEIFIPRPSDLLARAQTWSDYKHHNTLKYLIGISPQGTITFISRSWGGRTSDKALTESPKCKFLEHLKPGDVILADRGFDVCDAVRSLQAHIVTPAFMNGRTQLNAHDVHASNEIANVRIHVERLIGLLRRKFRILSSNLYPNILKVPKKEAESRVDDIVKICCALINLCPPIVPLYDDQDD